ncbi:hypothetical protein KI811_02350 [Geobacter hydrogenophilus]|nr:hypothetical protein [Geobacter hydrogenophilus]MBT0892665.1 hypothetical protein [Geobacter hydrogenophilus]
MSMQAKLKLTVGTFLCAAVLTGCGGGLNASNPDAPSSVNAHECTWVTTHPRKIIEMVTFRLVSSSTQATFSAMYGEDQLIQCRVCHGSSFLGASGGATGPACLDCHIADPIRYPAGCYSCHGGVALNPQDPTQVSVGLYKQFYAQYSTPQFSQYSTARQAFFDRVKSGSIHNRQSPSLPRNHDALAYIFTEANQPADTCRYCHNQGANANIHHSQAILSRYTCFKFTGGCHDVNFNPLTGEFQIVVVRDCSVCHK